MEASYSLMTDGIAGDNRCGHCVLPRSLGTVEMDRNGTCRYCRESNGHGEGTTFRSAPSEELVGVQIERIRKLGEGRPYDALVGLSGGRDSSYMTYLVSNKYKLRLVAAYYRTPFTPDITDGNVRRISKKLNIPLTEMSLSHELHIEAARKYFLLWYKNLRPEYASLTCAVCKLLNKEMFEIARRHNVCSIIYAGNPFENVQFLVQSFRPVNHPHSLGSAFKKMGRVISRGSQIFFQCPPKLIPVSIGASLLYINSHTPYLQLRYSDVHRLDFFHYEPWVETDCVKTIQNHLDWRTKPNSIETWKADCDFADLKNYMFCKTYGATYNDALYSNLIRAGQITREEAISRLRAGAGLSMEAISRVMRIMGLPMAMIDQKTIARMREL